MVVSSVQFCDAQNQVIHLRNSPLTGSKCTARESLLRWWTWIVVPCCKDKHPLLGNQGMSRNYLHGRVTMGESQTAQSLWSSSNEVQNKNSIFHVCACFPLEHLTTNGRRQVRVNLKTEERTKRNLLCEQAQVTMLWFTNNLPLAVSRHRFENYFCVASIYLHTIELTISLSPFSPSPPFFILSFHKAPTAHNSVFKSMLTDKPTKPIKNPKTL